MNNQISEKTKEILECEKWYIFALLMLVGGYYGAFTYSIRGGVFCNAQTANFVLLAMALGKAEWHTASYYFIPITAYFAGAFLSEYIASDIKKFRLIRWDTLLVFVEMAVVIFLGFLPETAPYQITQVSINFICSMQYNTFRETAGIPMATTFCTNHLRQSGVALCKAFRHRKEDNKYISRMLAHAGMLSVFVCGGTISTLLSRIFLGKAIWFALLPLLFVFIDLLYADRKKEKSKLNIVPKGH